MNDVSPLLDAFLRADIEVSSFRHADHMRVGFDMLQRHDFTDAASKYRAALQAMATRAGNQGAYHETMTLAFLALIAERRAISCYDNAEAFLRGNPDLLDKTILERWYSPQRLKSDMARRTFVLPEASR